MISETRRTPPHLAMTLAAIGETSGAVVITAHFHLGSIEVKQNTSNLTIDGFLFQKLQGGMDVDWIRGQLEARHLSQADLGAAIGLTSVQVNKILTGYRALKSHEADKIRRFFGYSLPEEKPATIAVTGRVGAGDHIELFDDYAKGAGMFHILRPDWLPASGVAAAQIDGNSAEPWALSGDIIFWSRQAMAVNDADLGRPVIAELADGRVLLKRLATGSKPNLWSLLSINPTHPNLIDVKLRWASRVLAPLPFDDVMIVEA